jgi:hypothetical protein
VWVICLSPPAFLSQGPRQMVESPGARLSGLQPGGGIRADRERYSSSERRAVSSEHLSVSSERELQKRTPHLADHRLGDESTSNRDIPEANDSRRRVQVDHRQVFWLPGRPSAAPSHRDTKSTTVAFEQRSSPVTAARPRPIFTAFPEPDHSSGKPVTRSSIRAIGKMSSLFRSPRQILFPTRR